MKILWLAHRDPLNPRAGGAERIIHEVCKRLAESGNEVSIFSCGWKNCNRTEILSGINILRFGHRIAPHLALPIFLIKNRYDMVIADLGHAVPWVSPILLRRKTIVSFLHLHARSLPGQVNKLLAYLITSFEKLYFIIYGRQRFVTISNTSRNDLIELGIDEKRVTLINPGVNSELFRPGAKTKYPSMIYFGGLRPYKRPQEALFLLKELLREVNNLTLTVIGDGPSRLKLEQLCEELCLTDNVEFTGRISDEEVSRIVARSWLNIHTSVTEGWGISIVEAASAGTPTVAYKVPGVIDSVESGLNGIVVENGNRKALAQAALMILRDPNRWWDSSIESAKTYSWDKTAHLWEILIKSTINPKDHK